jgi:hypothetical protein
VWEENRSVGLVGTAQRLHRLISWLPIIGMLNERSSLIEKRLRRRYVVVDEESEMDAETEHVMKMEIARLKC